MKTIINNVQIFDGTGSDLFSGSVVVDGNRIASISTDSEVPSSPEDQVIDGKNQILMPGLIDVHTHLGLGSTVESINPPGNFGDAESALLTVHCGKVMLDHGFTSGFSGGNASTQGELAAKKAFDKGMLPGPRLVSSSFERLPGGPAGLVFEFPGIEVRKSDPQKVVDFVNEMADAGVQAVKFLLNGVSAMDPGTNMTEQFYDEEIMAASEAAKERGLWLTAHCYTAHSINLAIKAGFRTLYHCTYADEAAIEALVENKDKLFIGLAPGIVEADLIRAPDAGVMASPEQREEQRDAAERIKRVGSELRKRGVKTLPGGDYGFPWNPIGLNARDLELLVEWFGYSTKEVLHSATELGGEAMGMGNELGLVKNGYLADLLIVNGNPIEELGILKDKNNLSMIMKDGKIHKLKMK